MKKNEILVIYGSDIAEMAFKLADEAGLADMIDGRGKTVGLKPNLVVSRPASTGATTHPEIAAGLIKYLKLHNFNNIVILEGSWTGDSTTAAFAQCGYNRLAADYGARLVDTQKDSCKKINCKGVEIEICNSALEIDFMINLPVLKGHCQTLLTCALKNNKGLIPDREKRRFHSMGLHKPIAHLNTVIRNDFILADGICGDLDFEEGGNPVYAGRLFAACDPVLCDAWAAGQLGYHIDEIEYIGLAEKLRIGSADLKKAVVRELSGPEESSAAGLQKTASGKVRRLTPYIKDEDACSSCYAAVVSALLRMDQRGLDRILKPAFGGPVSVGQGFRGKKGSVGAGICTAGFAASCPGCPPSGADVLAFLNNRLNSP